ncbi:hypothetical protein [Benzoatithermus flavus]|uniref:Uncharacterized protein n=1 Tax=Benzoatithermus flavus TaxID=3108223 RepID=A0ABU8XPK7_9PROT
MIELVLLACLLKEPSRCERHYVPTAEHMGLMECAITGQLQIVQWRQEHPDWVVRRWTCSAPRA